MSTSVPPMSQPQVWNQVADGYLSDTAPHLARYAADALRLAKVKRGEAVLDVATGPGTLALQAAELASVSAIDFAAEMVERLTASARASGKQVDARVADGMALPFADASFDAAFSMFGLMFFPDRERGFRELLRVLKRGGRAVVSSWPRYDGTSTVARFFGAFFADLPVAPIPAEGPPLSAPGAIEREMTAAGFRDVVVHQVSHAMEASSTVELVRSMIRGNVMVQLVVKGFDAHRLASFEQAVVERLRRELGGALHRVEMPAYLALGWR